MNPITAGRVVAAMVNVWPSWTVGKQTVEAWAAATPDVDPEVASAAVMRLAATDEFAPSIARFMNHVHLIERETSDRAITAGPVDHNAQHVAQERMRFLKVGWLSAAEGRPDHDHKRGPCPRCSTSEEWIRVTNHELLTAMFAEVPR